MKKLIYPTYSDNEEEKQKFINEWERINAYKSIKFRWEDYYMVTNHITDDEEVELWYDADLGLAEKIIYL